MEKFDLLLNILRDLQNAGVLKHCILVGSWCLDFYREIFHNPPEIPATKTMDADILLPRRVDISPSVNVCKIMEKHDFVTDIEYASGLFKFKHQLLDIEFLTDPGSKPDESIHTYKQLGISAQELRFMSIPLKYNMETEYDGITITLPEPEAFALHKLIVCMERKNPEKAVKDVETARGLFMFFEGKPDHTKRLSEIYNDLFKGWKARIDAAMKTHNIEMPR